VNAIFGSRSRSSDDRYSQAPIVPRQRDSYREHDPRVPTGQLAVLAGVAGAVRRCSPVVVHRDAEDARSRPSAEGVVDHHLDRLGKEGQEQIQQSPAEVVRPPWGRGEEPVERRDVLVRKPTAGSRHASDPATASAKDPADDQHREVEETRLGETGPERMRYRVERLGDRLTLHALPCGALAWTPRAFRGWACDSHLAAALLSPGLEIGKSPATPGESGVAGFLGCRSYLSRVLRVSARVRVPSGSAKDLRGRGRWDRGGLWTACS
jgi:hypothetical protein